MLTETMSIMERFNAAVSLDDSVDRHPVFPLVESFAINHYGVTQGKAWSDHNIAREAMIKCRNDFGYDIMWRPNLYWAFLPDKFTTAPVRNLIPGKHVDENSLRQIDERELFSRDDYDKIIALGWNGFWKENYEKISGKPIEKYNRGQEKIFPIVMEDTRICEERGGPVLVGCAIDSVMMAFSMCRTLTEFTKDLYHVPDKVEAAMNASCDDFISNAVENIKKQGKMLAWVILERGSSFYYRNEIFERFEWPFLKRYVDAFVSEGILPWLHFDTDYGKNLPLLKQLPKGKCVLDLDGTTNIFQAKEILGGHMCISGDVPAAMLTLGKPEEVESYCRKLIDEVGRDGGFMLTTGCECPIDARPENIRAMIETAKTYRGTYNKKLLQGTEFAEEASPGREEQSAGPGAAGAVSGLSGITEAFRDLQYDKINELVRQSIEGGIDPFDILEECKVGMSMVGELYSTGEYFLAELILSGDIFRNVAEILQPLLVKSGAGAKGAAAAGTVVIGTPKGDIHDIGKNITATVFKAGGFEVHDLGIDVSPEAFVDKVEETNAQILAMSALITPTFDSMKKVVDLLVERNQRKGRFVIIGGGPTTGAVRDYVGADAWSLDPQQGVEMCKNFIKNAG